MEITRRDVASQVADAVRQWIVDGEFAPSARINETHVAQRLKVSRTPVREALGRLVGEGALVAMPNLGFFVAEISQDELDEIYCLRPTLDSLALKLGGLPSDSARAELRRLNDRIRNCGSAEEAVRLDEQWHRLLISGCTNVVLTNFIDCIIDRTRRYELILFADGAQRAAAANEHARLLEAVDSGSIARACAALEANLTRGDAPLRARIAERQSERAAQ